MSSFLTLLPPQLYDRDAFKDVVNDASFDLGTARALMWLSQLAYERPGSTTVDDMLRAWRLTWLGCKPVGIRPFPFLTEPNVIVAANDAAIYVAFEGTDPANIAEVISHLNALPSNAGTHSGFEAMADALWEGIRMCVTAALRAKRRPLLVAGHSLGGAIGVLIAKKLVEISVPVTAVYTFGAPRAGFRSYMLDYNAALGDRTYRLVFGRDIVPAVPTAPYRHVGRYAFAASGRFSETVTTFPDATFPDGCPDEPALTNISTDAISAALESVLQGRVAFGATISFLTKRLLGRAGTRSDPVGLLIEHLPPPIRDHIPDRYWTALRR
jgi:triacylglycerol lipase